MSQDLPTIHLYVKQSITTGEVATENTGTSENSEFSTISQALDALETLAPLSSQEAELLAGEKTFPAPVFRCRQIWDSVLS